MVLNYPGPAKWIDMEKFVIGKAKSRKYRNRRIGEFLKEIELSEKQCTGITKILNALENNGSPPPEFETDPERHYLIVTIRQHEGFNANRNGNVIENVTDNVIENVTDKTQAAVSVKKRNARQNKILELLRNDGTVTIDLLAETLEVSVRTILRDIESLKTNDQIFRVGSDTSGYWEVKDLDEE